MESITYARLLHTTIFEFHFHRAKPHIAMVTKTCQRQPKPNFHVTMKQVSCIGLPMYFDGLQGPSKVTRLCWALDSTYQNGLLPVSYTIYCFAVCKLGVQTKACHTILLSLMNSCLLPSSSSLPPIVPAHLFLTQMA